MATDSVMGLFATPEQIQQQQYQQVLDRNIRLSQLSPFERANAMIGTGAYQLAGGIAGAMGAEDPQLKMAAFRRQVLSKVDQTDPTHLAQAAQALNREGDVEGARALAQMAQEAAFKQSQITKNLREGRAAGTKLNEVGVAEGTREPVYSYMTPDGQGGTTVAQVVFKNVNGQQQMVPYTGGVDRTTAKTNVGVKVDAGETEFVKELGKLDAKKVSESMTAKSAAIDQLKTLQKMAEVDQRPVISGTLAEQRTEVSNFFNTIGLSSSADRLKTANSQEYIKYSTGLVLDNLKKTGYNPSNADMKVVQSIIPRLETDPAARKELIKFMAEKANEVVVESNNLERYARLNKGLSGYTPKVPQVNFGASSSSAAAGLTTEQLKAIAGIK